MHTRMGICEMCFNVLDVFNKLIQFRCILDVSHALNALGITNQRQPCINLMLLFSVVMAVIE